jgi:hypothetical protein
LNHDQTKTCIPWKLGTSFLSHNFWDVKKGKEVELFFSLPSLWYSVNTIYEGSTFIFPSSTDWEVQYPGAITWRGTLFLPY